MALEVLANLAAACAAILIVGALFVFALMLFGRIFRPRKMIGSDRAAAPDVR